MSRRTPWWLLLPFPALVFLGQAIVDNPERFRWLFPVVNVGIVTLPSIAVAATVASRYAKHNVYCWPVSWREWYGGFTWGAVGATTFAGVINTVYLIVGGALFIHFAGNYSFGDVFSDTFQDAGRRDLFTRGLRGLPEGWGVFFSLSVLSICAPLNEEFWKGLLVGLFFFRKGGVARCFMWGVLAGTGFNLLETFTNSLGVLNSDNVASQSISDRWWLFALARGGTAAMHGAASGFSALGFYGLLRRRWRFVPCYFVGVGFHAAWNACVFVISADQIFGRQGPDSDVWDAAGVAGAAGVFLCAIFALWVVSGTLRDSTPAPIYRVLRMRPASPGAIPIRPPAIHPRSPLPR
jgi:hypothetical protein